MNFKGLTIKFKNGNIETFDPVCLTRLKELSTDDEIIFEIGYHTYNYKRAEIYSLKTYEICPVCMHNENNHHHTCGLNLVQVHNAKDENSDHDFELIGVYDNPDTGYAQNIYLCSITGVVKIVRLWNNAGITQIDVTGKVEEINEI